jgi:peptidyl-prolyl cis-trans isomerase D
VASQLDVGKFSEPVRTEQGYHILSVTEKEPEQQVPFEQVRDKTIEKLLQEKARKQVNVDADNFYELAYRKEDLEEPAKKFGFEVRKADGIIKDGGIPEVGSDPKIMSEAFGLKTGELSRLMKSGDNFVLLKLVEKARERDPELDEVRGIVERDYRKELALRNAGKKAEEIIQALRDKPNDAGGIAGQFGLKWDKLDPVSRTATSVPSLGNSPEVLDMLTSVTSEVPIFGKPIPTSAGMAVVRLLSVERASDEQYAREARSVEDWVREVRKTDFRRGWLRVLEEKAKIDLNEKML